MKTVLQKNFILEGRFTLDDDFYSLFDLIYVSVFVRAL